MADVNLNIWRVPAGGGYFDVERNPDPDYPGVDIEYIPEGEHKCTVGHARVLIEWGPDNDCPYVYIWDTDSEDYSHKIALPNINQINREV